MTTLPPITPAACAPASGSVPQRPLVRYHGGKWRLAPWIISHFPEHRTYVEPYGGGGSVLLRKPRCYSEVYNDLDGEIVNLFQVARDHGAELRRRLELTPFSRMEFMVSYKRVECAIEQARRTVVRAFMGFGSNSHNKATGFRANSDKSGTTPAHDWRNYPCAFGEIMERLRGVVIENRDASAVMLAHDKPTTLHYVDPPYVASTRDKGGDYRHEMDDAQHRALADLLNGLSGAVIVSGYPSPLYDEIYRGWHVVRRRHIADGGRERTECLWLRNVQTHADLLGLNPD